MKAPCDLAVHAHSEDAGGEPDLITVICLSFNTREYIAQCFDAILAQKHNYRLQIVVHDDASSDGSQDVIRDYADRYPGIFTPVLQLTNRWSLGFCPLRTSAEHVRGSFVAICEADDYWIEPDKLEQQLEFLNGSNRNFVGTQCRSIKSNEVPGRAFPNAGSDGPITVINGADIFAMRKYIHTSTFLMHRVLFDKWAGAFVKQVLSADLSILLTACLVDDGLAIQNRVTSHYRSHESGLWTGSTRAERYARYATTWQTILDALQPELSPLYLRLTQNNLDFFRIMSKQSKSEWLAALTDYGAAAVFRVGLNMLIRRLVGN